MLSDLIIGVLLKEEKTKKEIDYDHQFYNDRVAKKEMLKWFLISIPVTALLIGLTLMTLNIFILFALFLIGSILSVFLMLWALFNYLKCTFYQLFR